VGPFDGSVQDLSEEKRHCVTRLSRSPLLAARSGLAGNGLPYGGYRCGTGVPHVLP